MIQWINPFSPDVKEIIKPIKPAITGRQGKIYFPDYKVQRRFLD
jgi:hypothetical protein